MAERRRDPYYRAAQKEGLRSRAAFKLSFLASRYPILRPGARVLDLGAAPGGWSLVARSLIGARGTVVAVDQRAIEAVEGVHPIRGRVGDPSLIARLGNEGFDTVLSDLSPRISGAYATDHARSVDLVRAAFSVAREVLHANGSFVAKLFDGDMRADLEAELRPTFVRWARTKPPASREQSSEIYLIGLGFSPARAQELAVAPPAPDAP